MHGRKPGLPTDFLLSPIADASKYHLHSKLMEHWKTEVIGAYQIALNNSKERKKGRYIILVGESSRDSRKQTMKILSTK